jgi:Ni/Co efflux regulator RcnB
MKNLLSILISAALMATPLASVEAFAQQQPTGVQDTATAKPAKKAKNAKKAKKGSGSKAKKGSGSKAKKGKKKVKQAPAN